MKQNKYWFAPKTYGYGITPSSWEGWLLTLLLAGALIFLAFMNGLMASPNLLMTLMFVIETFILVVLFVYGVKDRTSGKIKWRWGKKD